MGGTAVGGAADTSPYPSTAVGFLNPSAYTFSLPQPRKPHPLTQSLLNTSDGSDPVSIDALRLPWTAPSTAVTHGTHTHTGHRSNTATRTTRGCTPSLSQQPGKGHVHAYLPCDVHHAGPFVVEGEQDPTGIVNVLLAQRLLQVTLQQTRAGAEAAQPCDSHVTVM